jgi:hypothetical protein
MKNKNIFLLSTDKPSRLHLAYNKDYYLSIEPFSKLDTKNYKSFNIYITNDEEIKEGDWLLIIDDFETYAHKHKGDNLPTTYHKKIILTTDQELIKYGVQAIDDEFLECFVLNPSCEEVDYWKYMSGEYSTMTKEEPKQSTKNKILAETSEQTKQKARDYGNTLVNIKITSETGSKLTFDEEGNIIKEEFQEEHRYNNTCDKYQEKLKQDYNEVHIRHCYQGEYEDGCKYGENNCPAKPKETEQETLEEAAEKYVENPNVIAKFSENKAMYKKMFSDGAKWMQKRRYSEDDMINFCHAYIMERTRKQVQTPIVNDLAAEFEKWINSNYSTRIQNRSTALDAARFGADWKEKQLNKDEEMLLLIQFLASEEMFTYNSISTETAKFFLKRFKNSL